MRNRWQVACVMVLALGVCAPPAESQTVPPPRPLPFPGANSSTPATPAAPTPTQASQPNAPAGLPMYPAAVFLETIDAGKGQQYHLYGVNAPFVEIVAYYKTTLKSGGRVLFQAPAMHQFDLGRFQEDNMAYPPSVVVKDYTWNGAEGYPHISSGTITRYRTVIQIVPAAPGR